MINELIKRFREKTARSTSTSTTGSVDGRNESMPEGNRFLKRKSKPTDSYYRLQAFLYSEDCKKWH